MFYAKIIRGTLLRHQQTLGSGAALPDIYCSCAQFQHILGALSLQICLQQTKCKLIWIREKETFHWPWEKKALFVCLLCTV